MSTSSVGAVNDKDYGYGYFGVPKFHMSSVGCLVEYLSG